MKHLLWSISLLLAPIATHAESLILGEADLTHQIAIAYNAYSAINGHSPQSWDDLNSVVKPLDVRYSRYSPSKRYTFLDSPVSLSNVEGETGEIVLMSRSPALSQYRMRGFFGFFLGYIQPNRRWFIFVRSPNGSIHESSLSEHRLREVFSSAGAKLPKPDPLGPRFYETEALFRLFIFALFSIVVLIFLFRYLFRNPKIC